MKAIVDWYSTATENADYSLLELPRDQAISRLNQMIQRRKRGWMRRKTEKSSAVTPSTDSGSAEVKTRMDH